MKNNICFWDIISPYYQCIMKNNYRVYRECCKEITPHLRLNMRVLEVACGTGEFTKILSNNVGEWIATDVSKGMIKRASFHKLNNVIYKVDDATNLSYETESFDAVLIANALHIIPNAEKVLKEIHRVLKRDALLFAPTFIHDEDRPQFRVKLLKLLGLPFNNKCNCEELTKAITDGGFEIILSKLIKAKPLSELSIVAKK